MINPDHMVIEDNQNVGASIKPKGELSASELYKYNLNE